MSNIEKPSHYQLEGLEPYESIDVKDLFNLGIRLGRFEYRLKRDW